MMIAIRKVSRGMGLMMVAMGTIVMQDVMPAYGAPAAMPQTSACQSKWGCGSPDVGCKYRCPLWYPCECDDDCDMGLCQNQYCTMPLVKRDLGDVIAFRRSNRRKTTTKSVLATTTTTTSSMEPMQTSAEISSWHVDDFSSHDLSAFEPFIDEYAAMNRDYVPDPAGGPQTVFRVKYPAGSYSPARGKEPGGILGGTGFYAFPIELSAAIIVRFKYQLYFDAGFDFVKGGKLPGLYGGHKGCSGARSTESCFSTRLMFRRNGEGELYTYLNMDIQRDDFCDTLPDGSLCNPPYGTSVGRGSWTFVPGQWYTMEQIVTINTPDNTDGSIVLFVDGDEKVRIDAVAWRTKDFTFTGIDFATFFGGSDASWATPIDQYTYFKEFSLDILQ